MPWGAVPTVGLETASEKSPADPPGTRVIEAPPIAAHPSVPVSNDGLPTKFTSPGSTLTATDFVALAPALSMTSTVAVQLPAAYVWVAVAPGCGPATVPSPKSKRYDVIVPSGSDDAEASAVTASGAVPEGGVTVSAACGGWLGGDTATWVDAVALLSPSSITCTVAVQLPAA